MSGLTTTKALVAAHVCIGIFSTTFDLTTVDLFVIESLPYKPKNTFHGGWER